mgnify:CR=1 FL=1
MPITGLFHIGIYTKNIDSSISFYKNILGFREEWRGIVDHPTGKVEAAVMRLDDCVIELVVPVDLGRVANKPGPLQHLCLKVDHLDGVINELSAKGIKLSEEGLEIIPTFMNGIRHVFVYGPSGERIELAEELLKD